MDWKVYYDEELRKPGTQAKIFEWLRAANQMTANLNPCDSRTILSFPHTAIDYSGPLQTRVVSWLYGYGFRRVIALGVVHGSLIPSYQIAMNERVSQVEREAAYEQLAGAFLTTSPQLSTPFGLLETLPMEEPLRPCIRWDHQNLLKREFSLDTFHAIVRLAADFYGVQPLPIIPMYVGLLRNPITGSFEVAAEVAHWLQDVWDEGTAIVTTGDVVHYGAFYGSEIEDLSLERRESYFREQLGSVFDNGFGDGKLEEAFQMSLIKLKSDQREILPLLVRLLGKRAVAAVEAFSLSDYSEILDTMPPCLVASALIAYKRRRIE